MQHFVALFQHFADFCPKNDPFFLISGIRASYWKKLPFTRKWARTCVYALVGSVGAGVYCMEIFVFRFKSFEICSQVSN